MSIYPLCDEQQYIFDVNESINSIPLKIMFSGVFSEQYSQHAICRAVEQCIRSADVCSARCVVKGDRPYLEFLPLQKPEIRVFHFSTEDDYQRFRDLIITSEINNRDKLHHIFVFSVAGCVQNRIHFCFNHLVFDGLSALILCDRIKQILITPDTEITWHPFSAFLDNMDRYKTSAKYLSDQTFWEDRFAQIAKCEYLFGDVIDVEEAPIRELLFQTSKIFKRDCWSYCSRMNVPLHFLVVAILAEQLHKKTGCNRFYIEIPIGNRLGLKEKNSIGAYEISLPFIFDFSQSHKLWDLLTSLQQQIKDYYRHKNFDWNSKIISDTYKTMYGRYIPQVCFSCFCSNAYSDIPFVRWCHLHSQTNYLPLTIYVHDFMDSETMTFSYVFWETYFTDEEITALHKEIEARITNMSKAQPNEAPLS